MTVQDLVEVLSKLDGKTPVYLASDAEANHIAEAAEPVFYDELPGKVVLRPSSESYHFLDWDLVPE